MARLLGLAVGASLLLLLSLGGADAVAAKKNPAAKQLRTLVRQTNALPRAAAPLAQRRRLARTARRARSVARRRPCRAVRQLGRYRRILDGVDVKAGRIKAARRVAALGPISLKASRRLLASRRTRRCGGGAAPTGVASSEFELLQSDENGMQLRVKLPSLRFVPRVEGGQTWTQLVLPNTDAPGAPGEPGIPVASSTYGVPDGATLSVTPGSTESYTLDGVDVFPAQPEPVDDEPAPDFGAPPFSQPPFMLNEAAYDRTGFLPPQPADGQILGTARDIVIGGLQVPAAQYDPAAGRLRVLTTVEVSIAFNGGSHTFSDELASPWEQSARTFAGTLLNAAIIRRDTRFIPRRCGEEMLVITNPATLAAANQFATARRAAGIRTNVFQTGTASGQTGTTAAQIQSFIRSRLTAFLCVHPSYVTIMGDDDLVPTFPGINGIPSDLPYSMRDDADELPDVAVGRIIGNDQAAVANAVTKIVNYETAPPGGAWLGQAAIAAQFQDDNLDGTENRTFIQFAETVRNGLMNRGVAVDRVYDDSPTATPLKFNDGTNLPDELKKPTFAWDGDGADVSAAWNAGRFLMVHRDHGYSDGWGHPGFTTTNVNALTNGSQLPVLMSINCSSAAYDYDETSFVGEALVKPNGGTVGAFGDTRDSPSWHNTQISFGFVDALLPSVLPAEGPALKQRVGNALIHGKVRLAGLAPPATDGSTRNELYLWHYFGDPSMQMWGGDRPPLTFDPALFAATFVREYAGPPRPDPPPYEVIVQFPPEVVGRTISLLRNGQVVGKAIAGEGGSVRVPADFDNSDPNQGQLQIAVDADGALPFTKQVDGVPQQTQLSIDCSPDVGFNDPATTTGTLEPNVAGATVEVTYTRPGGRGSFVRTTTTNGQGEWSDTIDTGSDDPGGGGSGGTWSVRARYAGDAGHDPSGPVDCTFVENDG